MRSLSKGLPRQPRKDGHFAAMPYSEVSAFNSRLRERVSVGRLALEAAGCSIAESASTVSTYTAQLNHVVNVLLDNESPQTGGMDPLANMRVIDPIRKIAK